MHYRRAFLWVLGIIIILALMLFVGWEEIKTILSRTSIPLLLALGCLQVATLAISAYQWHYLLRKLHSRLSFIMTFTLYLSGNFVESVTPSVKFGGEAARIYLFRRSTSLSYQELAGALLTHKYISLLPFVLLCAAVILISAFRYELPTVVYLAFFLLGSFFALICWLLRKNSTKTKKPLDLGSLSRMPLFSKIIKKVAYFLKDASHTARHLTSGKDRFFLISLSLVVWALYPVKVFLVATGLGFQVGPLAAIISTYTAYVVSMLPLLPGGLGSFEGTMALVFSLGGLDTASGMAIALLSRSITFWFPLLLSAGAVAYLSLIRK